LIALTKLLKPHPIETYTLAIWKRDGTGGHAITPYQVINQGGGKFEVLIYDNNYPDETRFIAVDTKADTWYYNGSTVATQPDAIYQGDSYTKTISLWPTSPGLGTQRCPFCGKVPTGQPSSATGATNMDEIYLLGGLTNRANLVVTDPSGHKLGNVNGTMVDQIPGAQFVPVIASDTWSNKITPLYLVPANRTYRISLAGTGLTGSDTESVEVVGPSSDVSVSNISMSPGGSAALTAAPSATKVSYTGSQAGSPTFDIGVSDKQADFSFSVAGVAAQPGGTISFNLPAEGASLSMANEGSTAASNVDLSMTRYTPQGNQNFSHTGIALAGGDTAQLQFGNWIDTSQGMQLVTTHDGQQSTQTLSNQTSAAATSPAGATGPQGTAGATGLQGPAGASGSQGPAGASGSQGPAGASASQGTAGASGSQGPARATGPQGPAGRTGPQGPAGRTGPQGPAGITSAWQGSLTGGAIPILAAMTPVVSTPSLPAGHYEVTANLTVAGSPSRGGGENGGTIEIKCWATPNSAPKSNSPPDGVETVAEIGPVSQSLYLNDLLTTTAPSDQIDLVCVVSSRGSTDNPTAQVTNASIIAVGITNATKTTTTAAPES
jgi:hypothetical protein